MLNRVFPRQADNTYSGHPLAIWILAGIAVLRLVMGLNSVLQPHDTAINADGVALATFAPAAAREVIVEFSLLGNYFIVLALLTAVVLIRYRAMIPLMYMVMLYQQLGARVILHVRAGAPLLAPHSVGAAHLVVLGILVATLIGFGLSLIGRDYAARSSAPIARPLNQDIHG